MDGWVENLDLLKQILNGIMNKIKFLLKKIITSETTNISYYLKRIQIILYNFIYKKNNIPVRFSAGVSCRKKYASYLDAKKKADDLLYQAKHKGRDRIIFDNKIEI